MALPPVNAASSILGLWSRWIDEAAAGLKRASFRLQRQRIIELREQPDGSFLGWELRRGVAERLNEPPLRLEAPNSTASSKLLALLARARVEVVLSPARFVFKTIELPRGADQFLAGVVRSQIDRLTPWTASDAAFGWSEPRDAGPDRVAVTVVATARVLIDPVASALIANRADFVRMSTEPSEGAARIEIWGQGGSQNADRQFRRYLAIGFGVAATGFVVSLIGWLIAGVFLESQARQLQDQIAQRRGELMQKSGSALEQAIQSLKGRKRTTPSAVMVMEELSKALPDDAHLTEMRMETGKVQMVGLAQDAPALIRLIEQSGQFSQATFFAPTVRAANGGETFHIEARPEPPFAQSN